MARYDGANGQPGSSVVQAYAWDLQTNSRREVNFVVPHAIKSHNKQKVLTDDRDIYELMANFAQRRVRTSLENVIPRDIVETAVEECRKTLKTNEAMTPEKTAKMVKAFAEFNVSQGAIEAWLQRRIDTMTPAQMVRLRRIYTSLRDGMSKAEDWFPAAETEQPKTTMEKAKSALRQRPGKPQEQPRAPETTPAAKQVAYGKRISAAKSDEELTELSLEIDNDESLDGDMRKSLADAMLARSQDLKST